MSQPRDFGFGEEEGLFRDQAKKLLADYGSIEKLRALVAKDHDIYEKTDEVPGWDREAWAKMVELGLPALGVPESAGGLGGKKVAIAAVVEQVGMHAFPSPLLATLGAAEVLSRSDASRAGAALERIAAGTPFALAFMDRHGGADVRRTEVSARKDGEGYVLDGTACYVQDGDKAEAYVVAAKSGDSLVLAVVDRSASGVSVVRDRIVDLTRDQVRVSFAGVRVAKDAVVAEGAAAEQAFAAAMPTLLVLVAADLVGISEWQLRTTAEYAKVREQFGRAIGTFQAVKHPLVDMMIGIDQARSLLYAAACAIDTEPKQAEVLARMAKAKASDVGRYCSGRSVQLHGGIGFTWECDVHMFFKRSEHDQVLLGDGVSQRKRLAEILIG